MENLTLPEATQLINFYKNKSSDLELQFLRMQAKNIELQEQYKQMFQRATDLQLTLDALAQPKEPVVVTKVAPPAELVGTVKRSVSKNNKKSVTKKSKK